MYIGWFLIVYILHRHATHLLPHLHLCHIDLSSPSVISAVSRPYHIAVHTTVLEIYFWPSSVVFCTVVWWYYNSSKITDGRCIYELALRIENIVLASAFYFFTIYRLRPNIVHLTEFFTKASILLLLGTEQRVLLNCRVLIFYSLLFGINILKKRYIHEYNFN